MTCKSVACGADWQGPPFGVNNKMDNLISVFLTVAGLLTFICPNRLITYRPLLLCNRQSDPGEKKLNLTLSYGCEQFKEHLLRDNFFVCTEKT
jgi:hypothetical protein